MEEDTFKCGICSNISSYEMLGNETKKGLLCKDCYKKEISRIINELDKFRKSKQFDDKHELVKKKLWLSQEMAYWHDITIPLQQGIEEVISQESVAEYLDLSVQNIQGMILDELITLKQEIRKDHSDTLSQLRGIKDKKN